jgi:hypothetical protein
MSNSASADDSDPDAERMGPAGTKTRRGRTKALSGARRIVRLYMNAAFAVQAVAERKRAKRAKQKV